MLSPAELQRIVRLIVARVDPDVVIVFGSYAKGRQTPTSDLDLFVVMNTILPMSKRTRDIRATLSTMLVPIDVHVYTPEEVEALEKQPFSFVRRVLRSGRTLYRRAKVDNASSPCAPTIS